VLLEFCFGSYHICSYLILISGRFHAEKIDLLVFILLLHTEGCIVMSLTVNRYVCQLVIIHIQV